MKKFIVMLILFGVAIWSRRAPFYAPVKDTRDGQIYGVTVIGENLWLVKNMNFASDSSWCYLDESRNCKKMGRLYSWKAAQNACPAPWRLPSAQEWLHLKKFLEDLSQRVHPPLEQDSAAKMIKAKSWGGNGYTSFNAKPAGQRYPYDFYQNDTWFGGLKLLAIWWSSDLKDSANSFAMQLHSEAHEFEKLDWQKEAGLSVRCTMTKKEFWENR